MAKQLQLRRGTTAQHSTFTGAVGEITVDTDKDVVVVHDGSTTGGFPLAKQTTVDTKVDKVSSTDNAIARYDGTGGAIQNSSVYIDDNGRLGVGTSSPNQKLTVAGNLSFTTSENSITWAAGNGIVEAPNNLYLRSSGAYNLLFQTQSTERMRIDSSGNVGIGTSSPDSKIHAKKTAGSSYTAHFSSETNAAGSDNVLALTSYDENSTSYLIRAQSNTGTINGGAYKERFCVTAAGNVGIGTNSPSGQLSLYKNSNDYRQIVLDNPYAGTIKGYISQWADGMVLGNNHFYDGAHYYSDNTKGSAEIYVNNGYASIATSGANSVPVERMRIDSAGNVGIGKTNPAYLLDMYKISRSSGANYSTSAMDASSICRVFGGENDTSKAATLTFTQFNSTAAISCGYTSTYAGFLAFGTSNGSSDSVVERMRINPNGNLLVGTTTDNGVDKLQVNGSVMASRYYGAGVVQKVQFLYAGPADTYTVYKFDLGLINNPGTSIMFGFKIVAYGYIGQGSSPITYECTLHRRGYNTLAPSINKITAGTKKIGFYSKITGSYNNDLYICLPETYSGAEIFGSFEAEGYFVPLPQGVIISQNNSSFVSTLGLTQIPVHVPTFTTETL